MKFYLVEAYSPDLKFENNSYVVALTPLAAYELDESCIKYSILEDYYEEAEFLKEEEAYFKDQLAWFDKFDNLLFNIFPEAKIKDLRLATSYYFYIKSMVDSIILRCKIINIFLNKVKPNTIIFISTNWKEDLIGSAVHPLLFGGSQSLFSRLMPIFCKKYDIEFRRIILNDLSDLKGSTAKDESNMGRFKKALKKNKYVEYLWHNYTTFNIRQISSKLSNTSKCNILFLERNRFIRDIMKDALGKGYGVYYKRGADIVKQSFGRHKIGESIYPDMHSISCNYSNDIRLDSESDILKWINTYCGIDVSVVILPRLLYFINEFCRCFISLIDKYISFYTDNQIDWVFTIHMVGVDEYAAIAAARYTEKTRSACLQHGDTAFVLKMLDFGEYSPYHVYFTTNDEREEYIKHRIELGNFNTKVFQYPNRYKMLPRVNGKKRKQSNRIYQKTLVYVPIMYPWDSEPWNESRLPDTWYFSWHNKLIDYFSSRGDFNFIWKGIPVSNVTYDPIPNMINDRKCKHIKYATEPFIQWIRKADLVLLDYPSTALYEAAVSGLPVMSLYFAPFNVIRESALKLFGRSLQPFSRFDEGIAKIDDFLNSNLNEFIVSIPRSVESIFDILDSLKSSKTNYKG